MAIEEFDWKELEADFQEKGKKNQEFYQLLNQKKLSGSITNNEKSYFRIMTAFYEEEIFPIKIIGYSKVGFRVQLLNNVVTNLYFSVSFISRKIKEEKIIGSVLFARIHDINYDGMKFWITRNTMSQNRFVTYEEEDNLKYCEIKNHYYTKEELSYFFDTDDYFNNQSLDWETIIMSALKNGTGDRFGFE